MFRTLASLVYRLQPSSSSGLMRKSVWKTEDEAWRVLNARKNPTREEEEKENPWGKERSDLL